MFLFLNGKNKIVVFLFGTFFVLILGIFITVLWKRKK